MSFTCFVKRDDPVHGSVIGQGDSRLVKRFGSPGQVFDAAQTIEKRELAVNMQVNKRLVFGVGICCDPQHGGEYNTIVRIRVLKNSGF
jgi:hypothetical protein